MIPSEMIRTAMRADICVVADRLGADLGRGKPNERIGRCPACNGDGQLYISIPKKTWRCRRCGKSGRSAIDFVQHASGRSFGEAIQFLADSP